APDETLLGRLTRGGLEAHADQARGTTRRIVLKASMRLDPHDLAVIGTNDSMLASVRRVLALCGIERGQNARAVLRVQALEPHPDGRAAGGIYRIAHEAEVIGGPDGLPRLEIRIPGR